MVEFMTRASVAPVVRLASWSRQLLHVTSELSPEVVQTDVCAQELLWEGNRGRG